MTAESVRRECVIEFKESSEKPPVLLGFLLEHSNSLRLTRSFWNSLWPIRLIKLGSDADPVFRKEKARLEDAFIREERNSEKYNNIDQGNLQFQHYFYRLGEEIIRRLKMKGLFFQPYEENTFYGFEDPTFFQDDTMIAATVSHERHVILYLTESERIALANLGIFANFTEDSGDSCLIPQ